MSLRQPAPPQMQQPPTTFPPTNQRIDIKEHVKIEPEPLIEDSEPKEQIFRAQPVRESAQYLINQMPPPQEIDDKDKSMMASAYPEIPVAQSQYDQKASVLKESIQE